MNEDQTTEFPAPDGSSPESAGTHPPVVAPSAEERYSIIKVHARGGMGQVLLVHDLHMERNVAMKQLLPERAEAATSSEAGGQPHPLTARFLREARITSQLDHPSITPVHDMGTAADGSVYYTMKFVKGKTLDQAIAACADLKARLGLLPHFVDLANAIAYAHSKGVIHRDIKPSNVMVGEFGETLVIDWGIAKVRGAADDALDLSPGAMVSLPARGAAGLAETRTPDAGGRTVAGKALGTPEYMPPEQARGAVEEIDERSDVYSLGAVLYEILTGRPPFRAKDSEDLLRRVLEDSPPRIRSLERDVPPDLEALCLRALSKSPDARPQSAKEIADRVERSRLRPPRRRLIRRVGIAALLSVLLVGGGITFLNWRSEIRLERALQRFEALGYSRTVESPGGFFAFRDADAGGSSQEIEDVAAPSPLGAIYGLHLRYPEIMRGTIRDLERGRLFERAEKYRRQGLGYSAVQEALALLESNQEILEAGRRIAAMPRDANRDFMQGVSKYAQTPWDRVRLRGNALERMTVLFAASAWRHALAEEHDAALQDLTTAFQLLRHLDDDPRMYATITRLRNEEIVIFAFNLLRLDVPYSETVLAAFQQQVEDALAHGTIADAIATKLKTRIWFFETLKENTGPPASGLAIRSRGIAAAEQFLMPFFGTRLLRFWCNGDETYAVHRYCDAIDAVRKPYPEGPWNDDQLRSRIDTLSSQGWREKLRYPYASALADDFSSDAILAVRLRSLLTMALAALALREHEQREGAPPPSLDSLARTDAQPVLLDPFTGQPFRYSARGNGFVIESAGPDGKLRTDAGDTESTIAKDDLIWVTRNKR